MFLNYTNKKQVLRFYTEMAERYEKVIDKKKNPTSGNYYCQDVGFYHMSYEVIDFKLSFLACFYFRSNYKCGDYRDECDYSTDSEC